MDWHEKNIKVYNDSARELAERFSGIGSRVEDIERAFELAGDKNGDAKVVEIGCGDGRDAEEIFKRALDYEGFDPSQGLLDIAKIRVPKASFMLADALSYDYPVDIDVVFAFASLLHIEKEDLKKVFKKISKAMRPGGIMYISLKEKEEYMIDEKTDEYGTRMFYYYNPDIIAKLAGDDFAIVYEEHYIKGHTDWFNVGLRRI